MTPQWIRNPVDLVYAEQLHLPSFGISVTRSDPSAVAIYSGSNIYDFSVDSGDAFSISYLRKGDTISIPDHDFADLDVGYLKRILLYVLYEEEYARIEKHHVQRTPIDLQESGVDSLKDPGNPFPDQETVRDKDERAQVRLTDLRLAKDIKRVRFTRELKPALSSLPLPLTAEGVAKWKWETLKNPKNLRERADLFENDKWRKEEEARVKAVSFAAAALLLLIDLRTPGLDGSSREVITNVTNCVTELYRVIDDLIDKFDGFAGELSKLLSARKGTPGGRPAHAAAKSYVALTLYRMGRPEAEIAWRAGILTPEQRDSVRRTFSDRKDTKIPVPKNWRSDLRKLIRQGVEAEKKKFPHIAEVFAPKKEEQVRAKAIETYRDYLETQNWEEVGLYSSGVGIGDDILTDGIPINQEEGIYRAFVQLGSCIKNGIDPLPTSNVRFFS